MQRLAILATSITVLVGCAMSAADLRSEPVRFSTTVAASWDRVSTCVKQAYMDKYSVVDLPVAGEQRTEVVVQQIAVFDVRSAAGGGSVVELRRRKMVGGEAFDTAARQTAERCP